MAFAAARMILKDKRRKTSKEDFAPRNRSKVKSHTIMYQTDFIIHVSRSYNRAAKFTQERAICVKEKFLWKTVLISCVSRRHRKKNDLSRIIDSRAIWVPFGDHFSFQRKYKGGLDYFCKEGRKGA